jgi:hypothetical protein
MNRRTDIVLIGTALSVLFVLAAVVRVLWNDGYMTSVEIALEIFFFGVAIFMGTVCFGIWSLLRKK